MSDTHEAPANEASEDVMNHDSTDAAQAGTPGTVPASACLLYTSPSPRD